MQDLITITNPTPSLVLDGTGDVPVTIMIGKRNNRILFDADPTDGTINITTEGSTDITFDLPDFYIVAELLMRTAEGRC